MKYDKLNLTNGTTLKAEHLAHMESGIAANAEATGKLTEEMVKTVNGIEPDAYGNVNLQVKEEFEVSGQCVSVEGMNEGGKINLVGNLTNPYVDAITYKVVHCGKNLLDCSTMPDNHTVPVSYDGDGWITFDLAEAKTSTTWVNAFYYFPWLPPLSKYKFCFELSAESNVTGTATLYAVSNNADEFFSTNLQAMTDFSTPGVYAAIVETKAESAMRVNMALSRMAIGFSAGAYGKVKMRPWIVKADDNLSVSSKLTLVYNESYPGYYGETLSVSIPGSYSGTHDWGEVTAFEGVNTFSTPWGELTASGEKKIDYGAATGAAKLDVTQYKLPLVFLYGKTAGMTKDNAVVLKVKFRDIIAWVKIKWQGSSSLAHRKKNYTAKFYADEACTQPLYVEIVEGWGAHHVYVFKANFMDATHGRNICSCILHGQTVKTRAGVPAEQLVLPNGGAIDGVPCILMLNDEFHGLYTWNIPKDGWMLGEPKAIVCADAHVDATRFKALATLDGDFDLEYVEDEDNADWVLTSLNRAIQAVMDSNGSDLDTVVGQYIDIPSARDYFAQTVDEGGLDGTDHNYILFTYDYVKWYFLPYDRDRTYGIGWNDDDFISPVGGLTYEEFANINRVMYLLYNYDKAALKARVIELHNSVMSEANVYTVFTNFMQAIPTQILDEDARLYPEIPSTNVHNLAQILNWYRLRRAYLDPIVNSWS